MSNTLTRKELVQDKYFWDKVTVKLWLMMDQHIDGPQQAGNELYNPWLIFMRNYR